MGQIQKTQRYTRIILFVALLSIIFFSSCVKDVSVGASTQSLYLCKNTGVTLPCSSISGNRCYYFNDIGIKKYKSCLSSWSLIGKPITYSRGDYLCYNDGTCRLKGLLTNPLVNVETLR